MFVSNAREAEPFVAPDLSEIRVLVDRATAGWFRSETNLARSGPAMRSGYRLVSRRKSGP